MKYILMILGAVLVGVGVIFILAGMSTASDTLGIIVVLLMGGIPAILGVFCILKSKKQTGANVPEQPTITDIPATKPVELPKSEIIHEQLKDSEPDLIDEEPAPSATDSNKDPYKYYSFKVAGISFYEKDVINLLAVENDDYDMTKKEIVDAFRSDENIYKYLFKIDGVQLVPEPDNPHDPNAIKVIADSVCIGYVPSKSTKKVKLLLDKAPEIKCDIYGGPSKIVFEENDGSYTMKNREHNIGAEVILKYI